MFVYFFLSDPRTNHKNLDVTHRGLKITSTLDEPLFAVIWLDLTLNVFRGAVGGPAAEIGTFEVDEILPEVITFLFLFLKNYAVRHFLKGANCCCGGQSYMQYANSEIVSYPGCEKTITLPIFRRLPTAETRPRHLTANKTTFCTMNIDTF